MVRSAEEIGGSVGNSHRSHLYKVAALLRCIRMDERIAWRHFIFASLDRFSPHPVSPIIGDVLGNFPKPPITCMHLLTNQDHWDRFCWVRLRGNMASFDKEKGNQSSIETANVDGVDF